MIKRSISGLLGGVLLLFLTWLGGIYFTLAIGLLVTLSLLEYARLLVKQDLQPQTGLMLIFSLLLLALVFVTARNYGSDPWESLRVSERTFPIILVLAFLALWIAELSRGKLERGFSNAAANLFGTVYIGFLFAYILLLRFIPETNGLYYVLFAFFITWANDSMAYVIGINFGKHKLCPHISPQKSVEGSLGGIGGGLIMAGIFSIGFHKPFFPTILLGFAAVIAGQLGDLVESVLKRNAGVKDSGDFLPGHGGVLDRFDSLLFTAPVVYYTATYIMPFLKSS